MTAPDRSTLSASSTTPAIGVDVSKASLEVALVSKGEASASQTVPNTEEGFGQLLDWIGQQADLPNVHACLEASGGYEQPVARFLHEQGLTVSVINPRRTSAYTKSQLTRSKTDQSTLGSGDLDLLARFCRREAPDAWQPASSEQKHLKDMTRGPDSVSSCVWELGSSKTSVIESRWFSAPEGGLLSGNYGSSLQRGDRSSRQSTR